jgi:hypothetical protein
MLPDDEEMEATGSRWTRGHKIVAIVAIILILFSVSRIVSEFNFVSP